MARWTAGGIVAAFANSALASVAILNTNGEPEGIEHFGVKLDATDDAGGLSQHAERRDATGVAAEHRVKDPDGNLIDLSVKGFMDRA